MIEEIILKNIATYNQTGVIISGLKKLNYFFGNNGCGKSTLAKYLKSISEGNSDVRYSSCSSKGYDPRQEEIIVFNQDFIENNFQKSDTLKGVFSLNQTNKDIDEKIKTNEATIAEKTGEQKGLEEEMNELNKTISNLKDTLTDDCFKKRVLFEAFPRIKFDHSGKKANNLLHIEDILKGKKIPPHSFEDLINSYKKLYEEELKKIDLQINIGLFDELVESQTKLTMLLGEVIVGKNDVKLLEIMERYDLRPWVSEGKKYLEKTKNFCPFCQQQITNDFISQLNDIFDESYRQKVQNIESEENVYKSKSAELLNNFQEVSNQYNAKNTVSDLQIRLKLIVDENLKIINEKIKAPNEKKVLKNIDSFFRENMKKVNSEIAQKNNIVNSIDEQRSNLTDMIWHYVADDCKELFNKYETDDKELKERLDKIKVCVEALKLEVTNLEQDNINLRAKTVNTKDAVDHINQILKNSGFMGFEIVEREKKNNISQYSLLREGRSQEEKVFNSLSEGEKNFISFLYFYQLCLGTTDIQANSLKKKIIVIDDPVSSMDSQVLFIVSTLVNRLIANKGKSKEERIEFLNANISQVFIMTHNYYFYKEVAMKQRPICKEQSHYLISKNSDNETQVEGRKQYEEKDDYSLMWDTIKSVKKLNDKKQNILLANLFRRILESYSNFIGLGHDAWATVLNDNHDSAEYELKCAFISMINDGSHKVAPFDSLYFQRIHNEAPSTLFSVFESIFDGISGGKEHYEKMMKENDDPTR